MKLFREMIGEEIIGLIAMMDPKIFQSLILHAVDEGGLWVENQKMTTLMLSQFEQASSSKTRSSFCHSAK